MICKSQTPYLRTRPVYYDFRLSLYLTMTQHPHSPQHPLHHPNRPPQILLRNCIRNPDMPFPVLPESRARSNNHAFFQQFPGRILICNLRECIESPCGLTHLIPIETNPSSKISLLALKLSRISLRHSCAPQSQPAPRGGGYPYAMAVKFFC